MHKITTIILLCCAFLMTATDISAQNADFKLLKSINNNPSTILRGYSRFVTNTTTGFALAAPVAMGAVALINKDDELLKNAIYVSAVLGVDGVLTYSAKKAFHRQRPYLTYPNDIIAYETEKSTSFPSGHTSLAFSTATALSLSYPKWYVMLQGISGPVR